MTRDRYIQLKQIIDMVNTAAGQMQKIGRQDYNRIIKDVAEDLRSAIAQVNQELMDNRRVNFFDVSWVDKNIMNYGQRKEAAKQYFAWSCTMLEILDRRYKAVNKWDERFNKLMDYANSVAEEDMIEAAKKCLLALDDMKIEKLCAYYTGLQDMWGALDVERECWDVIVNRVTALREHAEDFIWLYGRLGDWRSKLVLTSSLYNWMTFDIDYVIGMKEANYSDYFDLDLVSCGEEEVIVDLGTYTGDTIQDYIQIYGKYKKVYCYEIDMSSMESAKENLAGFPDIEFRNKGVGSENGKMYLDGRPGSSMTRIVDYETEYEIEVVTLDDDITERITLLKMDIEGAEQSALRGCERHIREEKPKLLISVYHNNEDIWKIARMIDEINPDYRFYLRSNGHQYGPAELVLFGL